MDDWIEIIKDGRTARVRPRGLEERLRQGWGRVVEGEAQEVKSSTEPRIVKSGKIRTRAPQGKISS